MNEGMKNVFINEISRIIDLDKPEDLKMGAIELVVRSYFSHKKGEEKSKAEALIDKTSLPEEMGLIY